MVVNTYGISVGIEKIGWKLYLVYIGWICVELVIIYFVSFFFFLFFFFWGPGSVCLQEHYYHYHYYEQQQRRHGTINYTNINTLFFSCSSLWRRQEKHWKNSSRFSRRRILARHLFARLKWPWLREVKWCMLIRYR